MRNVLATKAFVYSQHVAPVPNLPLLVDRTGKTRVDRCTPLLPYVLPEIDEKPASFHEGGESVTF